MKRVGRAKALLMPSAVAAVLLSSACGGGNDTPSAAATPVTAPLLTDTFTGKIGKGGANAHTFTVNIDGTVSITLVSLVPQNTINMGLAVGAPGAAGCNPVATQENVSAGTVVTGKMTAGVHCLVFYDAGNVVGTDDYTITVTHF